MNGDRIYGQAKLLHQKMYQYPSVLTKKEKANLYKEYFFLIKKAAYSGHPEAQFDFGQQFEDMNYLNIQNPNYNPKKCVYWYSKSCKNNHAEACNNLAHYYELGLGVKKSSVIAQKLYKKSSELGSKLGKKNYKLSRSKKTLK